MSTKDKFLEVAKRYGKKALVVLCALLLVVYSSNISAFAEATIEAIQEAVMDNPATDVPAEQTESDDGQVVSTVTKELEDVQLSFSTENVTLATTDGQYIGSSLNVSPENDLRFTASADDGYENVVVTYNGTEIYANGSTYTLSASQVSQSGTVKAVASKSEVQAEDEGVPAAEDIDASENTDAEGEGESDADADGEGEDTDSEEPADGDTTDGEEPADGESGEESADGEDTDSEEPAEGEGDGDAEGANTENSDTENTDSENNASIVDAGEVDVVADISSPAFEGYATVNYNGRTVTVKVTAPEGALPEGTEVVATLKTAGAAVSAAESIATANGGKVTQSFVIDVTLQKDGVEVQPELPVNVCFFNTGVEGSNVGVYRVSSDASSVETIADPRQTDGECVSFDTDHFTEYGVVAISLEDNGSPYGSPKSIYNVNLSSDDITKTITGSPKYGPSHAYTHKWVVYDSSWSETTGGLQVIDNGNNGKSKKVVPVEAGTYYLVHEYSGYGYTSYEYWQFNITGGNTESITVDGADEISVGETTALEYKVEPESADPKITWSSSDPSVATVDENGNVIGVSEGTVTITATATDSDGKTVTATKDITVSRAKLESVTIEGADSAYVSETTQLTATLNPTLAEATIVWSSSDETIATVDENGNVTFLAEGSVTITATATDKYDSSVTVTDTKTIHVSRATIEISGADTVEAGSSITLTATVKPNGSEVVWTSSDASVATVDSKTGEVTGVVSGTVTITASVPDSDLKATKEITVTRKNVSTSAQTVYVYTEVFVNSGTTISGLTGGVDFGNGRTWYTIGKINNFSMPRNLGESTDGIQYEFTKDLASAITNGSIDIEYLNKNLGFSQFVMQNDFVNWGPTSAYGVHTSYGATDYGGTSRMWHLDGVVDINATVSLNNWTYDGAVAGSDAHPTNATIQINGVTRDITPEITYYDANGTQINAPKDAGTYKVQAVWTLGSVTITTADTFTISKRNVTLTSATDSKQYDGTALTNGTITVGGNGFVAGEGATYDVTGSQTNVGSSANAFSYTLDSGTNEDNYNISKAEGTLTVTNRDAKYSVTVIANSETVTYDGKSHSASGLKNTKFTIEGVEYTVSGLTTSNPTKTDAGEYTNQITGTAVVKDASGNDVTSQFAVQTQDGKLTINKKAVTITANSASKKYDGSPLKASGYTITGLVNGQKETVTVSGQQTAPGTSEAKIASYSIKAGNTDVTSNYSVTVIPGTLTVTNAAAKFEITVTANSADATYDGKEHTASGFVVNGKALGDDGSFTYNGLTYTLSGLTSSNPTQKNAGTYTNTVTGSAVIKDAAGNDVSNQFAVTVANGSLVIGKANVTLKSADLSKEYDGTPLTNGDTKVNESGFAEGEGVNYTFTGSRITVGSSPNSYSYTLKDGTSADNYNITANYGTLTVTNRTSKWEITVEANSGTATYDGQAHSAKGIKTNTFTFGNNTYTVSGLTTEDPEKTDAGTYTNNITGTAVVKDANGNDVTDQFTVKTTNGSLVINKKDVTLTSASETKPYDGTALTNDTVTATGFVDGEGATYNVTGSQTLVGSSANAFTYALNDGTKADNYNITKSEGTLTITNRDAKYQVTVIANSLDTTYNGQTQSVSGFVNETENGIAVTASNGKTYYVTGLTSSASGKDVSDSKTTIAVEGAAVVKDAEGNVVTDQFAVSVTPGHLTIAKKNVTLKSASLTKQYDGSALTNNGAALETESGWVVGEGATYSFTGSQTLVGSSANAFSYTLNTGTNADNYNISKSEGSLTVTNRDAKYQIRLEANSDTVTYDGNEHSAAGVKTDKFTFDGNEYTVSGFTTSGTAQVNAGMYENNISGTFVVTDKAGNDVTSEFSVTPVNGALTINKATATLASGSAEKAYDGSALTNDTVTAEGFVGNYSDVVTVSTSGSQTDAGSSANSIVVDGAAYNEKATVETTNYTITVLPGTLTVTASTEEVVVTLTANSGTVTYNGSEHTVTGYTVESSNNKYTESDFTVSGTVSASGTNAGTYWSTFDGVSFTNNSKNFTNVRFETVNGTLVIEKAKVTITANPAEKFYGEDDPTFTAEVTGLVNGESISYTVNRNNASENVGTYTGIIVVTATESQNYDVTTVPANFTIKQKDAKSYSASVSMEGWKYDGTTKNEPVAQVTENGEVVKDSTLSKPTFAYEKQVSEDKWESVVAPVDAGTYRVTATWAASTNYPQLFATAEFTVTKRNVTLTSATDSKTYDGTALTAETVTVGGDMFVEGEGATYSNFASQTNIGEIGNTFEYALNEGTNADNYNITTENGTLTVTAKSITDEDPTIEVSCPSDVVYNGTEQKWVPTVTDGENTLTPTTDYTVEYSEDATNVGEVTVTITGTGNYSGEVTRTYKITPAPLTVNTGSATRTYTGEALTAEGSIEGFVNGETATFTVTGSQTDVGSSSNTYSLTWDGTASESNYTIASEVLGTLTVTQPAAGDLKAEVVATGWIYDGTFHEGAITSSSDSSATIEYTFTDAEGNTVESPVNAGTYTVTATWAATNNYPELTATAEFTIAKAQLTVYAEQTLYYTGQTQTMNFPTDVTGTGSDIEQAATDKNLGYKITGLVNGEKLTLGATISGSAQNTSYTDVANANSAAVTKADGETGNSTANYEIAVAGKLNIAGPEYAARKTNVYMKFETTNGGSTSNNSWYTLGSEEINLPDQALFPHNTNVESLFPIAVEALADGLDTWNSGANFVKNNTDLYNAIEWKNLVPSWTSKGGTGTWKVHGFITFNPSVSIDSWTYDGVSASEKVSSSISVTKGNVDLGAAAYTWKDANGNTLSEAPKDAGTYRVVASWTVPGTNVKVNSAEKTFTIAKRNVTLTSEGGTKVYDGTALTKEGVTVSGDEFLEADGITYKATGTQTTVGTSNNTIEVTADEKVLTNYNITKSEGTLEVTAYADEVVVTITENSGTEKYDGSEKKVEGYTVTSIDGPKTTEDAQLYTEADFSFSGDATVKGTDAGAYNMELVPENFTNNNTNFTNVKFVIVDGALTISPRSVTLTSATASKDYDGTALTNSEVTVTSDGFVDGQGATYNVTGTQTKPGTSNNAFTYALKEGTKATNYTITKSEGTLTVNSTAGKFGTITLTGTSAEATYDGAEHSATGVENTTFTVNGQTYTVSGYSTSDPTQTNAGSYDNVVTITDVKVTDASNNDVTSEFTIGKTDGKLVIAKRDVTLTSATASKAYDGSALTDDTVTVGGSGFVTGQGASYSVTGSQTVVGSSTNAFTYTLNEGTSADNYNITKSEGTLTVTNAEAQYEVTVTANSATATYDGKEHSATGMTGTTFEWNGHTYTIEGLEAQDPTATDAGEYTNNITGTAVVKDESGNDVTSQFSVKTVNGSLTINKRTVTLTSASAEKTYDGTALTNSDVTVSGDGFAEGEGASYSFTGSQTNVGSSENTFSYTLNENTKADNYTITTAEGTLKVNALAEKVTVTITENSGTATYDGTAKTVTGYAVTNISNPLYTAANFTFSGNATVSGTDAGTYSMELKASDFTNTSSNFTNVEFVIVDGTLTIQPRAIEVTGGYAEKTYDGTKLSASETQYYKTDVAYVTEGSLVGGATLMATNVGEIGPDVSGVHTELTDVVITANGVDVTSNYSITKKPGYITILPVLDAVTVTVTENSSTVTYNGTEQSVTGYTVKSISNPLYAESYFSFTGDEAHKTVSGTDAGTYDMGIVSSDFTNNTSNFRNVTFVVEDGTLTVNKRDAKFVSASLEKEYDGEELTNADAEKVTVAEVNEGWVDGQGIDVTFTGTQTMVGSSANSYTYAAKSGTNLNNYNLTVKEGTLNVTNRSEDAKYEITLVGASSIDNTYDGTEHGVSGVVTDEFTLDNGVTYKVSGYETSNPSSTDATDGIANIVTGTFVVIDTNTGQNVTDSFKISVESGTLTVAKRNVTLTSASDSRVYNGTALTNSEVTAEGFVAGEGATYNVTGSITNVGTTENTFSYTLNSNTKASNYNITPANGTLEVTPVTDEVVVTITENSGEKLYNGAEQSVTGYTVSSSNALYTENDFSFSGDDTAKGTNVGTYNMELTAGNFANTSANFTNVTFEIVDGTLEITPRTITVAGGYAAKIYDGEIIDAADSANYDGDMFTVSGQTLAGQTVTADMSGTYGPNVGGAESSVTNVKVTDGKGADVTSNYTIETAPGQLVIGPVLAKVTVTVNAASGSVTYDGAEKSVSGYTATSDNALYAATTDNFSFTGEDTVSGTNAGTYNMGLTASDFANTNTNFSNVEFVVNDGTLTIGKRNVTLTSATDTKTYDGNALTNSDVTVGGDGFATGEGATYDVTGSQTIVGSSANTFTYELNENTSADNYNITPTEGTLTVTNRDVAYEITVVANSATATYDGQAHSAKGFETLTFQVEGNTYTVSGLTTESPEATDAGTYTNNITGTAVVTDAQGNDVTGQFAVSTTNGTLSIAPRELTLTSGSASKTFDGTPLTNGTVTVGGAGFVEGEGATYSVTGAQTEVGSSANTFTYTLNENMKAGNYSITTTEGTLTVSEKSIEGSTLSVSWPADVTYNGLSQQQKPVVTDSETGKELVEGVDYDLSYSADTTNAGEVTVTVAAKGNYAGTLTGTYSITPAPLSIITNGATKTYDGTPLTEAGYTVSGLVSGEELTVTTTGTITEVGTAENTYEVDWDASTASEGNYTITSSTLGTLEVTNADFEVTATGYTGLYDGQAHGITVTAPEDATVTFDTANSYTDATDGAVTVTYTVKRANYNDVVGTQTVNILKRSVTMTSADANKTYDGTALTSADVTVTGDGFVEGEGATYDVTGTQTAAGNSANSFSYTLNGNTKAANYSITTAEGTLDVAPRAITITVGTSTGNVYNGTTRYFVSAGVTEGELVSGHELEAMLTNGGGSVNVCDFNVAVLNPASVVKAADGADVTANYSVNFVDGRLQVVKPAAETLEATVSIDGWTYDGTTADAAAHNLTSSATSEADGAAATYTFKQLVNGSYVDIEGAPKNAGTFQVVANWNETANYPALSAYTEFTIDPATITVTTNGATKVYDGEPLTEAASSVKGLVAGDTLGVTTTGTITEVGETPNTYELTWAAEGNAYTALESNYTVGEPILGVLKVTEAEFAVTSAGYTGVYDGQAHGITVNAPEGAEVTFDTENSYTDVTESPVTVTYTVKLANHTDVTGSEMVTITPATITITTGSATKVYDGSALTDTTNSVSGLVAGETLGITNTGSQTEVGTSSNTYELTWAADNNIFTAKQGNYTVVEQSIGTLEVTAAPVVPGPTDGGTTPGGTTPTSGGGLPAPLDTVVEALEGAALPIVEAVEGATTETIDDNGNPLAGTEAPRCWVHFYMVVGIIASALYAAGVVIRRNRFGAKVKGFDDDLTGKGKNKKQEDEAAQPTSKLGVQPATANGTEA